MESILLDLGILIIIASVLGIIFQWFKQPLIPAYIITGIIAGPILGIIRDTNIIWTLSEIGIAFLLFIVGLEIDVRRLKVVSRVATIGCIVKSVLMFALFYYLAKGLAFNNINSIFIGLIFSFSSTMVVVKILSEKNETNTLHGRILIGILLAEDILSILVLSFIGGSSSSKEIIFSLGKALAVILASILAGKFFISPLYRFVAKDQKLLFVVSLSFCFLFAFIFQLMGLSMSVGAFFAGIILASTPYNVEIASHIKPLRDFFAIIFFAALGLQVSFLNITAILIPLSVFIIVFYLIKPIIILTIARFFGYTFTTSFLTGLGLGQISEFSLLIVSLGYNTLKIISPEVLTLAILTALITMTLTTYFSKYEFPMSRFFSKALKPIDIFKKREKHLAYIPEKEDFDTVLVGYNRLGYHLLTQLEKMGKKVLIVDLDPEVIHCLAKKKKTCLYGDVGDIEIVERLNLPNIKLLISTVPELYDNRLLIKEQKKSSGLAVVMVTAQTVEDALMLYEDGADYVIIPHLLGGEHMAMMLQQFTADLRKLIHAKLNHIDELKTRKKDAGRPLP